MAFHPTTEADLLAALGLTLAEMVALKALVAAPTLSLSVAQPTATRIYQRDTRTGGLFGKGAGVAAVSATLSAQVTTLDFRLRDADAAGSPVRQDWTPLGGPLPAGTAVLLPTVPASPYRYLLDVRANGDTVHAALGTQPFGVGEVVAVAGQSLAVNALVAGFSPEGTIASAGVTPAANGYEFAPGLIDGNTASPLTPDANIWAPPADGTAYSSAFAAEFLRLVTGQAGVVAALIGFAQGSTSITAWQPGQPLYATLQGILDHAGKFGSVIWIQGHSDAQAGMAAATYQGRLASLFTGLASRYAGPGGVLGAFSRLICTIPSLNGTYWGTPAQVQAIRSGALAYVAGDSSARYVAALDTTLSGDGTHPNQVGRAVMARHFYRAFMGAAGLAPSKPGPVITAVNRAAGSAVIKLTVAQGAGGTALLAVGTPADQFTVFPVGTLSGALAIASLAIASATEIDLTLAAVPADGQALDVWYRLAGSDTVAVTGSGIYDNATDADGLATGRQLRLAAAAAMVAASAAPPAPTPTPTPTPAPLLAGRTATVAAGLMPLVSSYAGPAIRVRRSTDNTEQDIGFAGGVLDTAALTAFCGSGSGYVSTVYDQSGGAHHFAQPSAGAQPMIVNAGAVTAVRQNGPPGIVFAGAQSLVSNLSPGGDLSVLALASRVSAAAPDAIVDNVLATASGGQTAGFLLYLGNGYVPAADRAKAGFQDLGNGATMGWLNGVKQGSSSPFTTATAAGEAGGFGGTGTIAANGTLTLGSTVDRASAGALNGAVRMIAVLPGILSDADMASLTQTLHVEAGTFDGTLTNLPSTIVAGQALSAVTYTRTQATPAYFVLFNVTAGAEEGLRWPASVMPSNLTLLIPQTAGAYTVRGYDAATAGNKVYESAQINVTAAPGALPATPTQAADTGATATGVTINWSSTAPSYLVLARPGVGTVYGTLANTTVTTNSIAFARLSANSSPRAAIIPQNANGYGTAGLCLSFVSATAAANETLTLASPGPQASGSYFTLSGTYSGLTPTAFDIQRVGAVGWSAVASQLVTIGNGTFTIAEVTATYPNPNTAYAVRDRNNPANTATTPAFAVS